MGGGRDSQPLVSTSRVDVVDLMLSITAVNSANDRFLFMIQHAKAISALDHAAKKEWRSTVHEMNDR